MKRACLLIVVPALLVALGFAQTPAASINTDQTNIRGCLGGSDGNYTIAEDDTGRTFKITSSLDLKPHLGHDVTLVGHRASGVSAAAADNSFAVTELNMISEHCAAAAAAPTAAPTATVSTPSGIPSTPAAAATTPASTISTPAETAVIPAAAAPSPAAPVTTPAETVSTPDAAAASPAAPVTTPPETVSTPDAAAAPPKRLPAGPRRPSTTPAAAATTSAVPASTSSETISTPDAAAPKPAATGRSPSETASSETASASHATATKPAATARGGSLWILISVAVLVIIIGTLAPLLSRWRRRKLLERTGAQNLSFNHDASPDQDNNDKPVVRKAA